MRRFRRRQLLTIDHPNHPVDACGDASGEIAGLKFWCDVFVDNALCSGVGEAALQAVSDFDTQMTVVLGNDKQRAVVDLLAPDLPGFRNADRILLDGFRRSRRHDQHRDLAAFPCFQVFKGLGQRSDVAARERAGLIDYPPRERRHRDIGCALNRPAHHQRKNAGSCSVHRGQSSSDSEVRKHSRQSLMRTSESEHGLPNYFAGAAGVGLKSTFGAVEISFSFSTVKFGFSLYPNAIAVRLVGNERTVTL